MFEVAIITASDKGAKSLREDLSGPCIKQIVEESDYKVVSMEILPDDRALLADKMIELADKEIPLILTTGGTGFSPRDNTPEATKDVIERETPGISEAMRMYSLKITPRAMLSRATSGIRKKSLIINLPGSPKAVRECLEYLLPTLDHGLKIMLNLDNECAPSRQEIVIATLCATSLSKLSLPSVSTGVGEVSTFVLSIAILQPFSASLPRQSLTSSNIKKLSVSQIKSTPFAPVSLLNRFR